MHSARFFEVRKTSTVFEGMELGMREPPLHRGAVLEWDGGVSIAQRINSPRVDSVRNNRPRYMIRILAPSRYGVSLIGSVQWGRKVP
jgi:hypothetical protein